MQLSYRKLFTDANSVEYSVIKTTGTIACARTEDILEFPVSGGKHYGLTPRENEK